MVIAGMNGAQRVLFEWKGTWMYWKKKVGIPCECDPEPRTLCCGALEWQKEMLSLAVQWRIQKTELCK